MTRSSNSARAERINAALVLLHQHDSLAEAVDALMRIYGMSKRQAYRYLHQAQLCGQPVPVPDRKVAFTVKLPVQLIQELRRHTAKTGLSLSELVTQALEFFLHKGRRSGR